MSDRYCVFGECTDGLWDDEHIVSLSALTLYFDNNLHDLMRALEFDAKFVKSPFNFRWLHRAITLPGEPAMCAVIPLARNVTPAEYQRLSPRVASLFGPRLRPVFMAHTAVLRVPGKGCTSGFYETLNRTRKELDPDFYLARAAE
ncbi:hypothetical protein OKW40_003515 [Paraburkholderia sp. RAU6.4a]|uniref:hypothetical protein n=1 Tax=Paraburkholderia sp. RAU6.4a TaxID=2991067 RepID=UPI003D253C48